MLKIKQTRIRTFWMDILWLTLLFAPIYFLFLGNRPFATPDEARYVEIPREILATGDWITPRLNGVKYFEKPPLLYWIEAAFQYAFGLKEWVMRLPIVLFGLTGILSTYAFGQRVFNRHTALYSAFILGSSCIYFVMSRLIILDMAVSLFVTLSLFCFYSAQQEILTKKRRLFYALFTVFCAFGVLTKGIMALAVPGMVIILWATYSRRWRAIFPAYLPSNFVLFLLIAAPWHILASLKTPEFAYKYFIVEHVLRYATTIHLRHQPIWFFIPIIIGGFLPWSALFPYAIAKAVRDRYMHINAFLLIWAAFVFIFFSISQSKLIPYILPLFPPIALLLGSLINEWLTKSQAKWPLKHMCWLSLACGIVAWHSSRFFPELTTTKAALVPYISALSVCFFTISCCSLPFGLSGNHLAKWKKDYVFPLFKNNLGIRLFGISLASLSILLILIPASPHIQRPSLNSLVHIALTQRKPGEQLASYMAYFQDLPVYANEIVTVVDTKGELEFGTTIEDTRSWMMSREDFKKRLEENKTPVWIFVRDNSLMHLKNDNPSINFKEIALENGVYLVVGSKL
ncbi:MAG: phospholipid carrier-dependent glycosyltransferase [Pseudomonadota bacterium]